MKKIIDYLKLMRVQHYIKNLLVFLPLIFSKQLFTIDLLKKTFIGFVSFSLLASVIYIINDIMDVENDRKHEKKKNRPIASGRVKIGEAIVLAVILLAINIALNIFLKANYLAIIILVIYLVMNILYSSVLKHIPIIDITILAFGFFLRVLYGAQIIDIKISNWLYITILSLSFYMGLGKRRNEFKKIGTKGRKVLQFYNESFLTNNMYMFMGLGIVFYSLWCMDLTAGLTNGMNLIWTVPLVIIICMKYTLNIENDSLGDPVDVILGDKLLILITVAYASVMFAILYVIK